MEKMKLISLNAWGGKIREPFINLIAQRKDVDIFCFQEIYHEAETKSNKSPEDVNHNLFNDIQHVLPDHVGYFCPTVQDFYGIATFVRKNLFVKATGDIDIFKNPHYDGVGGDHDRKALWVEIDLGDKQLSVLNVHGLWNGKGKEDTPERLEQSQKIRDFMDSVKGEKIICGDFNLLPHTKSLSILADGMQNLIKEYGIKTTRTSYYTRAHTSGLFADYIFVSSNLKVSDFKVLSEEVSDHAALFVEIM